MFFRICKMLTQTQWRRSQMQLSRAGRIAITLFYWNSYPSFESLQIQTLHFAEIHKTDDAECRYTICSG